VKNQTLFLISILFATQLSFAQTNNSDTLSKGDVQEIKYLSESFIEECELLLNTIADPELGEYKRNEISENSYDPSSGNQIFVDADVIIEDDINPEFFAYSEKPKDSPVRKYLNDLDLFYEKSVEPTISFTDVETFDVDKKDYAYSTVYFKSFFRGQHRIIRRPYRQTERIATIKAERIGKRWKLSIVSIVFYNPEIHKNKLNPDISTIPLELKADISSPIQTDSTISLKWRAEINNVYPLTYNLYEGGMLVGKTRDSTFEIANLEAETAYDFYLTAIEDSTGRISSASESATFSTKEKPKPLPVKSFAFKDIADVYKKGFIHRIEWENKSEDSKARLEIWDDTGTRLDVIEQGQLREYTDWEIDYLYKAGTGYQFVIYNPEDPSNRAESKSFRIARKVPLFLKVAPILVVGAVVGVIAGGGGSE